MRGGVNSIILLALLWIAVSFNPGIELNGVESDLDANGAGTVVSLIVIFLTLQVRIKVSPGVLR